MKLDTSKRVFALFPSQMILYSLLKTINLVYNTTHNLSATQEARFVVLQIEFMSEQIMDFLTKNPRYVLNPRVCRINVTYWGLEYITSA